MFQTTNQLPSDTPTRYLVRSPTGVGCGKATTAMTGMHNPVVNILRRSASHVLLLDFPLPPLLLLPFPSRAMPGAVEGRISSGMVYTWRDSSYEWIYDVYVYICMSICMYVYIYIYIYVNVYIYIHSIFM